MGEDSNALIAVAIILLILVIMYGGGCMSQPQAGTMVVQDKAVVTGPANVAVAPIVSPVATPTATATTSTATSTAAPATTTPNPAASAAPKTSYDFDPKKPPPASQVERLTMQDASNLFNKGVGTARSLYNTITINPPTQHNYLDNDQDVAKLFRPTERMRAREHCCGERLTVNPQASALFQQVENAIDPSYYTGSRKRSDKKNHKKERFVDANGNWQSFMYWKVGCAGDPRPLADRVDMNRLPHVVVPEGDVSASLRAVKNEAMKSRKERLTQRQKLEQSRGYVSDQGSWVRGN